MTAPKYSTVHGHVTLLLITMTTNSYFGHNVHACSSAEPIQKRSPMTRTRTILLILLLCQESLMLLCAAVPTGTRCPPVKGRERETCVCQTDKGVIDLTPVATTDGTPRWNCRAKQTSLGKLIRYFFGFTDFLVWEMATITSTRIIPVQYTPLPCVPMFTYVIGYIW